MLNKFAEENIKLIYKIGTQVWGDGCEFDELVVLNSPYPEFELPMLLYKKVKVLLTYDRSMLRITVQQGEKYIYLGRLTEERVETCEKSCSPERLIHDFQILDEVAHKLIASGEV